MWPPIVLLALSTPSTLWVEESNETTRSISPNVSDALLPDEDSTPEVWKAGIDCIDRFAQIFFYRTEMERYTRAYNLLLANTVNMSSPAAEILQGFSERINEAVNNLTSDPWHPEIFQMRVISDNTKKSSKFGEIVLSDNYVIVVDTATRLKRLMRDYLSQRLSWNPGARFLILYHNKNHRKAISIATQIFEELRINFYVHRVALIFADTSTTYNLLVNDYYSNIDCRILNVQRVGSCMEGILSPSDRSVKALINDYNSGLSPKNCTFEVCAAVLPPFVEADCVLGIEMRILGFMRNRLNFTTNTSCVHETRGEEEPQDSMNWTGLLKRLLDGECDFIMGGFYPDNDVAKAFWGSDCYLQDSHTWYVKLAKNRPPWQAMIGIFTWGTWLCCSGTLVICWLVWYALVTALPEPAYYQQMNLTAINALAVSICVAVYERPVCQATRLFFMALTLYGVLVVANYTSKMIATFQDPGLLHQMDELEEVVAAGIPFGGFDVSRDWFQTDEDMWIYDAYNYTDPFEPLTVNLQAVKEGTRCILSNRMYILQSPLADDIYPFPNNVFSSPIQMIMKAGFPFLSEMNFIIRNMRDAGIFQKIDDDFIYNNTYLNRIDRMRPQFAEPNIVLTTDHLLGPFFILILGVCCASVTFAIEVMHYRKHHPQHQVNSQQELGNMQRKRRRHHRQRVPPPTQPSIRFTPLKRRKVL